MRASLRLVLLLALAGPLAACLQPVNAPQFAQGGMAAELAQVSVSRVEGYLGYIVKSELDFLLSNGQPSSNGRYAMVVRISTGRASSIIESATNRPQSVTLQAEAVYELRDTANGTIRASGKTFGSATYDRSVQRFANLRAQRDAEEKLGKSLAERLRIILISALADPERRAPPAPQFSPPVEPWLERPAAEPGDET
ncbi:COG5468 Predicted secreted (periplasmic) protein [Rhabdaerophilaceae bacterium]